MSYNNPNYCCSSGTNVAQVTNNCYYGPSFGMDDAAAQTVAAGAAIVFSGANAARVKGYVQPQSTGFLLQARGDYAINFNVLLGANTAGLSTAFTLRLTNLQGVVVFSRSIIVPYDHSGQYVLGNFIPEVNEVVSVSLVNATTSGVTPVAAVILRAQLEVIKLTY